MKMFIFAVKLFILLSIVNKLSSEPCNDFKIKNGELTFCEEIGENVYNVTIKCFDGYELQRNITTVNLLTSFDYYDLAQCKSCSINSVPNQRILEKNHITLDKVFCSRTILTGYCYSGLSYIDFKCKNNYTLDDRFDSLRVKCMSNYSWGLIPFCNNDEIEAKSDDPVYYLTSENNTQSTSDSQVFVYTDAVQTTPIDITEEFTLVTDKPTQNPISSTSTLITRAKTTLITIIESKTISKQNLISNTNPTTDQQVCSSSYPRPKNHQNDKTIFNLINHETVKNGYKNGSYVRFKCQSGYYVINNSPILNLTTFCQSNGTWTPVADCNKLACWDKLPEKLLNGQRTITLLLSKYNYSTDGTSVSFTCDPYFELVGHSKIVCKTDQWDASPPTCKLKDSLCLKKPIEQVKSAKLIYLKHVEIKVEKDLKSSYKLSIYTNASYTCPNNKFQLNQTVKYDEKKVGYVEVACIGKESWPGVLCSV